MRRRHPPGERAVGLDVRFPISDADPLLPSPDRQGPAQDRNSLQADTGARYIGTWGHDVDPGQGPEERPERRRPDEGRKLERMGSAVQDDGWSCHVMLCFLIDQFSSVS